MPARGFICLMYHELERPGRSLCQSDRGYQRYVLPEIRFRDHMRWLRSEGWRGMSVGEALTSFQPGGIVITFDDGCETDLIAAAPILTEAGFHATFYVTAGFVGRPGYMSAAQLHELSRSGFEIGCHSMSHAYLNDLSPPELEMEIVTARAKLEEIIGGKVEHFSCPGGRFDRRVLALAKQAGYRSVANSRVRANSASTDPYGLGRIAITRELDQSAFEQICKGDNLWKMGVGESLRSSVRNVLGNTLYDRVRNALFRLSG